MKLKSILNTSILSLAIVILGFLLYKAPSGYVDRTRTVQVKGLAEREVKANMAIWPAKLSLSGNDLHIIKTQLKNQSEAVKAFLKEYGITDEEIMQGATNVHDMNVESYSGEKKYRYHVVANFTVRTHNIGKMQTVLSKSNSLLEKGILIDSRNSWEPEPVRYIFTELNNIKPEMIEEATKNAREVAQKFALDSNSKLGKIKSANQGIFSITNVDESTPEVKLVRVVSSVEYFLQD